MDHSKLHKKTLDPLRAFDFSQANLQDFRDCRRRFQLRYLEQLRWPAPQAEPIRENEAAIRRGERFHRFAQQALLGVPVDLIEKAAMADPDPALAKWWHAFAAFLPSLQGGKRLVEILLAAPLDSARPYQRLLAKYDLVQLFPDGRALIYDWKTAPKRPRRASLEARLQTRVYPYLLAQAGQMLNGGKAILPEQIEMVYWFTEFPGQPERFVYSQAQFASGGIDLRGLTAEIGQLSEEQFVRTDEEKRCRFCVYRSLCARGADAGSYEDSEEDLESEGEVDINFEQISEISF
jgi:hypothetical protein